jgi:hypothetical protein
MPAGGLSELIAKRLEMLRELVPKDATIGLLVNPNSPNAPALIKELLQAAAKAMDQAIQIIEASSESQLDAAFASLRSRQIAAILANTDPFLDDHLQQLVALGSRYGVPAIYQWRQFTEAGALLSDGPNLPNFYRQVAVYAGPDPQGGQAKRSTGRAAHQNGAGNQSQDREHARDHHPANSARPSRRGDRISAANFRSWREADIRQSGDVCKVPQTDPRIAANRSAIA